MNPNLSIIIPCYNCEKTLEEAVVSCYMQDLSAPFEIIMVDDKSTDNTRDLMQRLSKKYGEIKLFYHAQNMGGGAARNTAVANSTGEVIFCLDSDDILPKGTLDKMYKYLKENNCDGVTIHRSIKFNGTDIKNIHHIDTAEYLEKKIILEMLLQRNGEFCPIYVNFMYTRNAFNKLGGYPTTHGYDTQGFAWRFLCSGLTAFVCKDSEYLHRMNFNQSYYVREYNNGSMNYNWRDILLENYYVFSKDTLDFICNFNCKDFTRNIMVELLNRDNIFTDNYDEKLGKKYEPLDIILPKRVNIRRNSVIGYYLRIKSRLSVILKRK